MVSTVGNGVLVKLSRIDNGGYGLFSYRSFVKNEYITTLSGRIISREEALALRKKGKDSHIRSLFMMGDCIYGIRNPIDAIGKGSASFVNDGRNIYENNNRFENKNNIIWLWANRDIEHGEELLTSYGRNYWNNH